MKKTYFPLLFLLLTITAGCALQEQTAQARSSSRKSQIYYQRAVGEYQKYLARNPQAQDVRLELGMLYYEHAEFPLAIEQLKQSSAAKAKKYLALSYYKSGDFTDALDVFSKEKDSGDDELLYHYGLTCERLNLFDLALEVYGKIKSPSLQSQAAARVQTIEKQANIHRIQDLSPDIHALLAKAPDAAGYPQAGALILRCDEKILVSRSNTELSTLHYLIKILNERGKEGFSEISIEYDSTFEKVELEFARTIKADGTVVDVGTRHMRDVSKYLNFPLYSNARVFIISFPEIAEGCAIEYKVKIVRNQLINTRDFVVSYPLQTSDPVISADFSITVPSERAVNIRKRNERYNTFLAQLQPDIASGKDETVYSWHFKDIPQIIPEANMPPEADINPSVLISSFQHWKDLYQWWWGLAQDKIKADKAIIDKVKELTRGLASQKEKAQEIYNFCAQKIRYVAVEYGQAGYEPHRAEDIFRNKYGDCKDQAVLLVTMLKEAGIPAWPVLIPTRELYNLQDEFPAMLFNHCIGALELEGKLIFMDPTAETCSFGDLPSSDQGRRVLLCKENGYELRDVPLFPASHNQVTHTLKIKVSPQETISAEKSVDTSGVYQQMQRYWFLYTPPELVRAQLEEKIQGVAIGARLGDYTIKNLDTLNKPLQLRYAFSGPEVFTLAGSLRIMPQIARMDSSLVAKDRRVYPLYAPYLNTEENTYEISLPDGLNVKYLPESVVEDNQWFSLRVEYQHKNRVVSCTQKTVAKATLVSQEDYPRFKKLYEDLCKKVKRNIVLEKGK